MNYPTKLIVLLLLLTVSVELAGQRSAKEGIAAAKKTKIGDLLIPRYGLSAATDGQWIYVYGGSPIGKRNGKDFMQAGLEASIERVDPITLQSEYFGGGLYRRANHASIYFDDKLISCGGRTQVGLKRNKLASCEFLEFKTGLYKELPPLPDSVRTLGMAQLGEHLYVVGGVLNGAAHSSKTYRLDLQEKQWKTLPDAPFPVSGMLIPMKKDLYAIGGYNGQAMKTVMVFNTESQQWERRKDLPYPLSAFSAISDGTSIYIFGDYVNMDAIHRYDTKTGDLYLLEETMTPRRHAAAVLVKGRAIVLGGNQSSVGRALSTIEAFDLATLRQGKQKIIEP
ncbi:MAG: hypothetical protein F6K19_25030 [Cyanothece sp. SIO1E1]|nr:hypothetical protein [Cyanothece sp. SIO1E1]